MTEPNFRECETVEEANQLNLEVYSFVKFSDSRDKYIFKKRSRK